MRIWSIHPKYLDAKGIVALWRETLLAKHVLIGKTKGYKNHPQLYRFKELKNPLDAINEYLEHVHKEAKRREYNFNASKISKYYRKTKISVTSGQIKFEFSHLLKKIELRDPKLFRELNALKKIEIHPLFYEEKGKIEDWEIL